MTHLADAAGVPPNAADHRALLAALYQERAGWRRELAKVRAEEDAGKRLREGLAALDGRIRSCGQADLDLTRAEVARLEAAVGAGSGEMTRVRVDMNAPPRVTMLARATAPEATATASTYGTDASTSGGR